MSRNLQAPDISPGELRRGLHLSVTASALGMVFFAVVLNMPFLLLLEALGASGFFIGLFGSIRQISLLAQIPGSLLIESLRQRKKIWAILATTHRLLVLIPAWLVWRRPDAPSTIPLILTLMALSFVIESLSEPAWTSWMADLVPPTMRGRFWGRRQAFVSIVSLLSIGGAGWLLDYFRGQGGAENILNGFALLLLLAGVFGASGILVHTAVPEPTRKPAIPLRHWTRRLLRPLRHPSFRYLALSLGVWSFACTMTGAFNTIYLKRVFGASYTELSLFTIAGTLGMIAFCMLASYLIERTGARTLAIVVMCIAPVFGAAWFFVNNTPITFTLPLLGTLKTTQALLLMSAVSLLSGGIYSMVAVCHLSLLAEVAPKRERTLAMALHFCLIGGLAAGGGIAGGRIVDFVTAHPTNIRLTGSTELSYIHILHVLHAIIIWTLAMPLMLRVRARREPLNVAEGFGQVILVNPIRFAFSVYQAQILSAPSRRQRRLQAVEALANAGTEITVSDLIRRLDDPVIDVREAAALALGRIGGREAHRALLAKIDEPDNDLTLIALRALRYTPTPRLVDRLLNHLDNDGPYVVREVVRTLGACGDPKVTPLLIDLLNHTYQGPLVAITAEILGRLGDIAALYVMVPRFRLATKLPERKALATACGDLLGRRDGFYKLLAREESSTGAGVAHDLQRARRQLFNPLLNLPLHKRFDLRQKLIQLEKEVEDRNLRQAAAIAFSLAAAVAYYRYNLTHQDDTTTFMETLEGHDAKFAVGVWFLAVLNGAYTDYDATGSLAPVEDELEIQLAVHVVASWMLALRHHRQIHSPPHHSRQAANHHTPGVFEQHDS